MQPTTTKATKADILRLTRTELLQILRELSLGLPPIAVPLSSTDPPVLTVWVKAGIVHLVPKSIEVIEKTSGNTYLIDIKVEVMETPPKFQ